MFLLAGNVFVIAAIILERNLQNVANYLVASLAVADLFVACLVMPLGALYEVRTTRGNDSACSTTNDDKSPGLAFFGSAHMASEIPIFVPRAGVYKAHVNIMDSMKHTGIMISRQSADGIYSECFMRII